MKVNKKYLEKKIKKQNIIIKKLQKQLIEQGLALDIDRDYIRKLELRHSFVMDRLFDIKELCQDIAFTDISVKYKKNRR